MPTSDDRRAALVLLVLAALGLLVRWAGGADPPGAVGFRAPPAEPGMRARVSAEAARLARPLKPGERIDVDRAPAAELARLPRIGAGLAASIVADRKAHGPFGSLEALDRVSGVGKGTLAAIRSHVTFSAHPAPPRAPPAASTGPRPPAPTRSHPVHVNSATARELESLSGIGPALAKRILADRAVHGPYARPEDLLRVRGIGPATLKRLRPRIVIP